jgi:ABC-type antimicrobial peptide transport system permease subunit
VTLETFFMLLVGAFAGLAMGLASARYLGTLLYQVSPSDPAAMVFPSVAILAMALLAAAPPAVRALRTDPAALLRAE